MNKKSGISAEQVVYAEPKSRISNKPEVFSEQCVRDPKQNRGLGSTEK